MKNITNAYLVLSVADIRALLHAAELEQQVRGDFNDRVSVVLQDITVNYEGADKGNPQIASWSVVAAANASAKQSTEDLEVFRASRNASNTAQSVRDALGMK